ncbi:MAG: hypothetical protein J2P36_11320 [Ktedonobacteraceae bacterium]|nr:hypothetical protein [Ktedonobacteraceae bacterium]
MSSLVSMGVRPQGQEAINNQVFIFHPRLGADLTLIISSLKEARNKSLDINNRRESLVRAMLKGEHLLSTMRLFKEKCPEIDKLCNSLHFLALHKEASHGTAHHIPPQLSADQLSNLTKDQQSAIIAVADHYLDLAHANFSELAQQKTGTQINSPTDPKQPILVGWQKEASSILSKLKKKEEERFERFLRKANLGIVQTMIENFFMLEGAQLILDAHEDSSAFPTLTRRASTSATIELDLSKIGPDLNDLKNARIKQTLLEEKTSLQALLKLKAYKFISNYLEEHDIPSIEEKRAKKIERLLNILLHNTKQLSEEALLWILFYALEASSPKSEEQFTWTISLGGDQEPAPLVEGYLLEPLQKLQQLSEEQVAVLPRLLIIGTFRSQIIENCKDKLGRPINEQLHTYNSRVTLARVIDFIQRYYPTIADRCTVVEFPDYQKEGAARTLFAALWTQFSPQEREKLVRMFTLIRGEVSCPDSDTMQELFGEDSIPYVGRHIVSNGHMIAGNHVLRFGAKNTEPQFWLASSQMRDIVLHAQECLLATIKDRLQAGDDTSLDIYDAIKEQIDEWRAFSEDRAMQGQLGMNVPALYYRRPDEPSLEELVFDAENAIASCVAQTSHTSKQRLEKLQQAYYDVIARTDQSDQNLRDFQATWQERYLPADIDQTTLEMKYREQYCQLEGLPHYKMNAEARRELNFWLD